MNQFLVSTFARWVASVLSLGLYVPFWIERLCREAYELGYASPALLKSSRWLKWSWCCSWAVVAGLIVADRANNLPAGIEPFAFPGILVAAVVLVVWHVRVQLKLRSAITGRTTHLVAFILATLLYFASLVWLDRTIKRLQPDRAG